MFYRLVLVWLIYSMLSCSSKISPSTPNVTNSKTPSATLSFQGANGAISFQVSVAGTEEARQKGLMGVTYLANNAGMLFIFPTDAVHPFWMKDTPISLDIIFMDHKWTVVGIIENAVPYSQQTRSIGVNSRYVLEINSGLSQKLGIRPGMKGQYAF